jgi:hypothetical protein
MDTHRFSEPAEVRPQPMLEQLAELVPGMQQRSLELDRNADFPAEDMDRVRSHGALAAPLPLG